MKAFKILIIVTFFQTQLWALPDAYSAGESQYEQSGSDDESERSSGWHKSGFSEACEKMTVSKNWKNYEDVTDPNQIWDFSLLTQGQDGQPVASLQELGENGKQKLLAAINSYNVCHAYMMMTDISSYSDKSDRNKAGKFFNSISAGGIGCLNQATQQEQQQCMAQQEEQSSEMECKHKGFVTEDYESCKSLLKFADGFFIAKQGLQTVQTVATQVNAMDSQAKVQREVASGNDVSVVGLGVQQDSLKQGSSMAMQQGALDGAKAAALLSKISSFPDQELLIKRCVAKYENSSYETPLQEHVEEVQEVEAPSVQCHPLGLDQQNHDHPHPHAGHVHCSPEQAAALARPQARPESLNQQPARHTAEGDHGQNTSGIGMIDQLELKIKQQIQPLTAGTEFTFQLERDVEQLCGRALGLAKHVFVNGHIADQMKALATQAAIESAANFAKGAMLNKMAGQVGDAIKDIESFEPPEFEQFVPGENAPPTVNMCLADPTRAGCPDVSGQVGYQGFAGQNFNATVGGAVDAAQALPNFGDEDEINNGASRGGNPTDGLVPNSFGSATTPFERDGSFKDGKVTAGAYKSKAGATGGGGGGGGGGGASPPGQAPQTGSGDNKPSSGITNAKVKMKGDGLATVGGRGRLGARKSKSKNPFAKLLGKKTPKNGVLNFRGVASLKKNGNLFQMISKRYGDVHSDKRLLEYKQK